MAIGARGLLILGVLILLFVIPDPGGTGSWVGNTISAIFTFLWNIATHIHIGGR